MGEKITEDHPQDQGCRAIRPQAIDAYRGDEEDMGGIGDEQNRQILGEMGTG
jgi:hypothetical protein